MPRAATKTTSATRRRGAYAKSAETRGKILDAALEAAEEFGFHAVSLAEIARRAGVAVGNVSYHFGSRDELLREAMLAVTREIQQHVMQAGSAGNDIFERGEAGIRAFLSFLHEHPTYTRLSEEVRHHHPDFHRETLASWVELQRSEIRRGVDERSLRPMSDEEISATAYLVVGAHYFLDQMIEGIDGRTYPGDDVVADAYMKLFRGGLEQSRRRTSKESAR